MTLGFAFTDVVGGTSIMMSGVYVPAGGDSPLLLTKTAGQSVGASFLTIDPVNWYQANG